MSCSLNDVQIWGGTSLSQCGPVFYMQSAYRGIAALFTETQTHTTDSHSQDLSKCREQRLNTPLPQESDCVDGAFELNVSLTTYIGHLSLRMSKPDSQSCSKRFQVHRSPFPFPLELKLQISNFSPTLDPAPVSASSVTYLLQGSDRVTNLAINDTFLDFSTNCRQKARRSDQQSVHDLFIAKH